ncbi:unnamed protein product [Arabidopsis thaliana]|uniref:(thale cress) hypothetical protein n=1 Tax=Arabidopsis thaliana TaxID=3702 RepID=A0A7G2F483_ARATH|nr:unnamed protein product [Arabidopsis thaliana]
MARLRNTLCLVAALLLINQKTATSDFLSPLFAPVYVECGKGKCKAPSNTTFMYECECEDGWKQFDQHLKFLPCITPNCTFDLTCGEAASPAQPKPPPKDNITSFFDPCQWMDCGGGLCNSSMPFQYSCNCREGYSNLMNITTFPCLKQCALGMDCLNLGIPLSNSSSSSPPALPDSSKNQGLNLRGSSLWTSEVKRVSLPGRAAQCAILLAKALKISTRISRVRTIHIMLWMKMVGCEKLKIKAS